MPSKKTDTGRPKRGTAPEIVKPSRKRRRSENYTLYIQRVQKEKVPKNGISSPAMNVMNSLVTDIYGRVSTEGIKLMKAGNRSTLSVAHIEAAVRMIFPGELAQDAITNGRRAVNYFVSTT